MRSAYKAEGIYFKYSDQWVIPVGIITALTGGPFFLYLLRTRRLV